MQDSSYLGRCSAHRADEHAMELLQFVRNGGQPLEGYRATAFVPKIAACLAKILKFCHSQFGNIRQTNISK